jgi:Fe-S cluster biogenesis protein NfuA|tara:strand:+ start:1361 stop:1930 length:570 start_codon:yes stop_codon:yes gene_type:complete
MFVQIEQTPNPATLKFIPGVTVMSHGTQFYQDESSTGNSILAEQLFRIKGVESVFYGADFITISKNPSAEWHLLKPAIMGAIITQFVSDRPLIQEPQFKKTYVDNKHEVKDSDSDTVKKIKEILDVKIRPAVAMDGGDIIFESYQDGWIVLEMQGACQGCPSSTATLKSGIENMMKHYIPEVRGVRATE